jgi:hypothetical protein
MVQALLLVNAFALFAAEAARGLTLASGFNYAERLAPGSGLRALALGTSLFSVGRLVASFVLGWCATAGVPYRRILIGALALQAGAHVAYAVAGAAPAGHAAEAALLLSRTALGFSSGTLGTTRAVLADVTAPEARTRAFAVLSLAKFIGFALTPACGIAFAGLCVGLGTLPPLDECTAPAWLGAAMCLACAAAVARAFPAALCATDEAAAAADCGTPRAGGDGKEGAAADDATLSGAAGAAGSGSVGGDGGAPPPPPPPPLALCDPRAWPSALQRGVAQGAAAWRSRTGRILFLSSALYLSLNFITKGIIAVAETALAPTFQAVSGAAGGGSLAHTSEFSLGLGLAGLAVYACLVAKPRAASAARALEGAAAGDGSSAAPAPMSSPRCCTGAWAAVHAVQLDVLLLLGSLVVTAFGAALTAVAAAGASARGALPALAAGFALLWSLSAPIADVLTVSLYSTTLSQLRVGAAQAALLGYVSASGALGRIVLPAFIAAGGVSGAFAASAALTAGCAALTAVYYAWLPGEAERARVALAHGSPFAAGALARCGSAARSHRADARDGWIELAEPLRLSRT